MRRFNPVQIGSLTLDIGLVNGSGVVDVLNPTEGWNTPDHLVAQLGAFVTKTVTAEARKGHPEPVVAAWGSAGSLVNSVGLANPGLDTALELWQALSVRLQLPIIASVEAQPSNVADLVEKVASSTSVSAIELNLSCPNLGGTLVAASPLAVSRSVAAARAVTDLPLIAKLTPAGPTADVVRAAEAAGTDAITCGNTMPVIALDADGSPALGNGPRAGLSGVDLHPLALRLVTDAAAATELPIIGLGGVDSPAAMRRMHDAGASVIGVGTAAWFDPHVIVELRQALQLSPAPGHD
jgi:dihydroorotate dehydrogenase (NAD+) catalytic subunit